MSESASTPILHALGLCSKARKLICGTEMICTTLPSGKIYLVIEACDTSVATHKKITDKCHFYKVDTIRISVNTAELAHAIGKASMTAAVGITDPQMVKLVYSVLEKTSKT